MAANIQIEFKSKLFAALAYLVLILGWIGLLVDVIGYFLMKDKYVKFHSGQALLMGLIITIIELLLGTIFIAGYMNNPLDAIMETIYNPAMYVIYAIEVIAILIYIGCAIAALVGKEFRIPIIAKFLGK